MEITWDLGREQEVVGLVIWHYSPRHGNLVGQIGLRFASRAGGPTIKGGSGVYLIPSPTASGYPMPPVTIQFSGTKARFVTMTLTQNLKRRQAHPQGGDRVGLGDFAFIVK